MTKQNKVFYIILFILFMSVYAFSSVSLLLNESFVLFIAFSMVLLLLLGNKNMKVGVSKEEFKFEETVRFLILLKNWNRALIRLVDIKMYHYLMLVDALHKYQVSWLSSNINKVQNSQYLDMKRDVLKRLNILSSRKKSNVFSYNTIQYLPLGSHFVTSTEGYKLTGPALYSKYTRDFISTGKLPVEEAEDLQYNIVKE